MKELEVGTRVYNGGDRANESHFGTITKLDHSTKWGNSYEITPDADSERTNPYWIPVHMFKDEYLGDGRTRFVTEEAYNAWRTGQLALLLRR